MTVRNNATDGPNTTRLGVSGDYQSGEARKRPLFALLCHKPEQQEMKADLAIRSLASASLSAWPRTACRRVGWLPCPEPARTSRCPQRENWHLQWRRLRQRSRSPRRKLQTELQRPCPRQHLSLLPRRQQFPLQQAVAPAGVEPGACGRELAAEERGEEASPQAGRRCRRPQVHHHRATGGV